MGMVLARTGLPAAAGEQSASVETGALGLIRSARPAESASGQRAQRSAPSSGGEQRYRPFGESLPGSGALLAFLDAPQSSEPSAWAEVVKLLGRLGLARVRLTLEKTAADLGENEKVREAARDAFKMIEG